MSTSSIIINGTDRTSDVVREGFSLRRDAGFRSSDMTLVMRALSSVPEEGEIAEFYDEGVLSFAGKILTVDNNSILPEKSCTLRVVDWYESLMAQLVRTSFDDYTLLQIIQTIVQTKVLDPALKLMLQFEEGSGTTPQDSTQYENHAVINGAGYTWDTVNYALQLDGTDGTFVSVPDTGDLDFSSDFSLCVDVTMDGLFETVLAKDNPSGNSGYRIFVDADGDVIFTVSTGNTTSYSIRTTSTPIAVGVRSTIVCTYEASSGLGKIYVDGVLEKTGSLTTDALLDTTGDLLIGAVSATGLASLRDIAGMTGMYSMAGAGTSEPNFEGTVFRVSVYSKQLTAAEARRWCIDILEVKCPQRLIDNYDGVIQRINFPYVYPADCFSTLARELGMAWRIDEKMFIHFIDTANTSSSLTLDEDDGASIIHGTLKVQTDMTQVRNAIFVRGGVYGGNWQMDTIQTNGVDTSYFLPYKYKNFEMFSSSAAVCGYIGSWYKMEDATGNLADQKSVNTLTAANLTYQQTGKLSYAIDFNGTTSSARKTSATHVTGATAHSFTAWIKPDVHDTTKRYIVGIGDYSGGRSTLSLIKISTTYYLRHEFSGSVVNDYAVGDLSGAWHLVGMSYDPEAGRYGKVYMHLDGELATTIELGAAPSISAGVIEVGGNNGSNVFDGLIDEVSYFLYSLTEQEHQAIYLLNHQESISAALVSSGVEFLQTEGYDAYYSYSSQNQRFTTAPSNGLTMYTTGKPEIPVQSLRTNPASIELYGRRELSIEDGTIDDLTTARRRCAAELARRKSPTVTVRLRTYKQGISPGIIVTMTLPSYGITSRDFYVQRVSTSFLLPTVNNSRMHAYDVDVVTVPSKDWIDFLRDSFLGSRKRTDPSEGEANEDLVDHSEDVNVAEVWSIPSNVSHAEVIESPETWDPVVIASGGYKWSNDAGSTTDKLRWDLGDWG